MLTHRGLTPLVTPVKKRTPVIPLTNVQHSHTLCHHAAVTHCDSVSKTTKFGERRRSTTMHCNPVPAKVHCISNVPTNAGMPTNCTIAACTSARKQLQGVVCC
jgi:hypothetical protein